MRPVAPTHSWQEDNTANSPDPYEETKKQIVDYWRRRAQEAEKEVARLQQAWADATDLIVACRRLWAAMEKIG